jgi:hypothetical protein
MRRAAPLLLALTLAGCVYFYRFGRVPVNLGGDEAQFAVNAHAIASTGRDLSGRFMPLFVNLSEPAAGIQSSDIWYQPALFYLTALTLKLLPFSEGPVRLPTAVVGLIDIGLMYLVAWRLFERRGLAFAAALMLALSPAHLVFSRQGLDYICLLPFILGWLLCLSASLDADRPWLSFGGGLLLGLAVFSYIAAWVLAPILLVLTWLAYGLARRHFATSICAATIGFLLPLFIAAPWLWLHPGMFRDTVSRYHLYDNRHLTWLQGVRDVATYDNFQDKLAIYWDYFSPSYLFLTGGANMTTATRQAGVFLWPVAVLLLAGLFDLARRPRLTPIAWVLIGGLAAAPLPATLVGERYAIQRELAVLPFGVLIAAFGLSWMLERPRLGARVIAIAVLLAIPLQFAAFARDYFGEYQLRSAIWFDPVDFRDVAEYLLSAERDQPLPAVHLSEDLDDAKARWRFYLAKYRREDLLQRTRYFRSQTLDARQILPGSLLVLSANDPGLPRLLGAGGCAVATTVVDIAGSKTAVILRKTG